MQFEHPVRLAAGRARVDRGDALYLADVPVDGFFCEPRGHFFALTPGEALLEDFARWLAPWARRDGLALSLAGLLGVAQEDRRLLIEGIKLLDLGAKEPSLTAYERRLRQRAAVCLREKRGGDLLAACAACLAAARQGLTKQ